MHELAVCQALLDQVAQLARERQARRVVSITLKVGPLSGIEPALLASAYPVVSAGTLAADAALLIERPGVRVRCLECGAESQAQCATLMCGACGHWRVEILSGDELLLASVELEAARVGP
jgi:hydrogenase nickel incorporation protein HypA/HybF